MPEANWRTVSGREVWGKAVHAICKTAKAASQFKGRFSSDEISNLSFNQREVPAGSEKKKARKGGLALLESGMQMMLRRLDRTRMATYRARCPQRAVLRVEWARGALGAARPTRIGVFYTAVLAVMVSTPHLEPAAAVCPARCG